MQEEEAEDPAAASSSSCEQQQLRAAAATQNQQHAHNKLFKPRLPRATRLLVEVTKAPKSQRGFQEPPRAPDGSHDPSGSKHGSTLVYILMPGALRARRAQTPGAQNRPGLAPEPPLAAHGGSKSRHEGPKRPPRRPQRAPARPQMGPRRPGLAQDGPRGLQDAPGGLPRGLPTGPRAAEIVDFHYVFLCFSPSRLFGVPALQDGPRGPQDRSKTAEETP